MTYYLGVDIGTTSVKAVAFSITGDVLASNAVAYDMQHPQPGFSEQNSEEIFEAVVQSINSVTDLLTPYSPQFVSFGTAMHSVMAVDEAGIPLTSCIIWADNRAASIAEKLRNTDQGKSFYHATGVPIHPMSPLCKLLWLREYQPHVFSSASKFIGIKEYVFYKFFGEFLIDTAVASATGLLNINTLEWDTEVLDFVGINVNRLSQLVSTKYIFYLAKDFPGLFLQKNIPFVIGASDGALSNLGSGAVGSHTLAISIGTSGAARIMRAAPQTDSQMRTFCYHVKDRDFIIGGASNNGAVVLQWLKENVLQSDENFEALFEQAATVAPGSNGLILLPYIFGERAPIWNANAKGVFFGLTIQHQKAHLVRATLESVIYSVYSIGKVIIENTDISEIYASGGFVNSTVWLQMLSDVFNVEVRVSGALEAVALGAVLLGKEALHIETTFQSKIMAVYYPNADYHRVYKNGFEKFERLYQLLKEEMQ